MRKSIQQLFLYTGILATMSLIAACSGDSDGGHAGDLAEDYGDGSFVADDGSVGRIEVDVLDPEIQVARTSGYFVRVFDAAGAPVPNIKVSCDSEQGVAVIEPNTGTELTNSNGEMSGRLGCRLPGSWQFACRLPVGANRRKFVDIKCNGPIPNGFTGFPDASGGGLGTGGSGTNEDGGVGGVNPEGVRITSISISDNGGTSGTTSIDTTLGDCDEDPLVYTAEPFFDTQASFTVTNNSNSTIRFTSLTYQVPNASGSGSSSFTSNRISLIGEAAPNGGQSTFSGIIIFDAANGGKRFHGSSANMPSSLGFRNITFSLSGTNDQGDDVTITGSEALSFDSFNNCGG